MTSGLRGSLLVILKKAVGSNYDTRHESKEQKKWIFVSYTCFEYSMGTSQWSVSPRFENSTQGCQYSTVQYSIALQSLDLNLICSLSKIQYITIVKGRQEPSFSTRDQRRTLVYCGDIAGYPTHSRTNSSTGRRLTETNKTRISIISIMEYEYPTAWVRRTVILYYTHLERSLSSLIQGLRLEG